MCSFYGEMKVEPEEKNPSIKGWNGDKIKVNVTFAKRKARNQVKAFFLWIIMFPEEHVSFKRSNMRLRRGKQETVSTGSTKGFTFNRRKTNSWEDYSFLCFFSCGFNCMSLECRKKRPTDFLLYSLSFQVYILYSLPSLSVSCASWHGAEQMIARATVLYHLSPDFLFFTDCFWFIRHVNERTREGNRANKSINWGKFGQNYFREHDKIHSRNSVSGQEISCWTPFVSNLSIINTG